MIAQFIALVLGVVGAIYFSDLVAELLTKNTEIAPEYVSISAFSITFIGIIFLVHLVARIVNQAVKMVALAPLNKIMGGVFSMAKTLVILSVVFYVFDFINANIHIIKPKTLNNSIAYSGIRGITESIIPMVTSTQWYDPAPIQEALEEIKESVAIDS